MVNVFVSARFAEVVETTVTLSLLDGTPSTSAVAVLVTKPVRAVVAYVASESGEVTGVTPNCPCALAMFVCEPTVASTGPAVQTKRWFSSSASGTSSVTPERAALHALTSSVSSVIETFVSGTSPVFSIVNWKCTSSPAATGRNADHGPVADGPTSFRIEMAGFGGLTSSESEAVLPLIVCPFTTCETLLVVLL